ncbi:ribosomal protein S5 domain 2-type protein [Vararia minispora EC-137]|uniref:Ribosomal protein S5 domain 2-type protein n=1 Tax=Vararia minispora EC-137 TaxID=1314806 RepID=A0ACB8QRE3_9AGAM|nr:ribosomal protein S5 domain 2-type protein [Vararia minispora EC-137]
MDDLQPLLDNLLQDPDREALASEIQVLQSIYGDHAIKPWSPPLDHMHSHQPSQTPDSVRYEVTLSLPPPHEDIAFHVLVSLPPSYPSTSPPQLQLLSRYIGSFGVDADLFGSILKTYISATGIEFVPDVVCVFDGLANVLDRIERWYKNRLSVQRVGELSRDLSRAGDPSTPDSALIKATPQPSVPPQALASLPDGVKLVEADPIVDRKSAFVGRACRISDPVQVPAVLAYLMADKRIARAAHPIINAWRCQVGSVLHQDNDDDGETAAGGRLAHLLQILEVNNVLVVVTRYYGGIHLGPDRFKHINQAARDALELGGFLDTKRLDSKTKGAKK